MIINVITTVIIPLIMFMIFSIYIIVIFADLTHLSKKLNLDLKDIYTGNNLV